MRIVSRVCFENSEENHQNLEFEPLGYFHMASYIRHALMRHMWEQSELTGLLFHWAHSQHCSVVIQQLQDVTNSVNLTSMFESKNFSCPLALSLKS